MAGPRRSGFGKYQRTRPDAAELRSTFGSLLRTTLAQVGTLKDAVERRARDQKEWLDHALLARRRTEALAALGDAVYRALRDGAEALDEIEGLADLLAEVAEIDEVLDEPGVRTGSPRQGPAEWLSQLAHRGNDNRFDDRDDGTVSSRHNTTPPTRRTREPLRVWRPEIPPDHPQNEASEEAERASAASPRSRLRRPRGDGIDFAPSMTPAADAAFPETDAQPRTLADLLDDDDDLASYMHEDDVPKGTDR